MLFLVGCIFMNFMSKNSLERFRFVGPILMMVGIGQSN